MKRYINKKKSVALMCAFTMFLASCGGGSTPAASAAPSEGGASAEPAGKAKITFMLPSMQGNELKNEKSDEVIAQYEAYTNTEVEWRFENNGTYDEIFGLTLMDKENMPMILTYPKNISASIVDAAKKGAFWDLTPYLADKEKFPNLSQANENILDAMTVDGQIIGVYRGRPIGRNGLSYRTDWAEKVGITEEPKTAQDVYDMFYKFTYEDPDGNGKNDTYGMELTKYTGPFDIMQTWFGVGNGWVEQNGELVPVHLTPEYREALKMFNKMYNDGLVRKDWATVDTAGYSDAVKKGEAGAMVDVMDSGKRIWQYYTKNDVKSVVDPTKTATMTLAGEVNGKTLATSGNAGLFMITKAGAKTEQDVINCLTFLDKMCDPEMMLLADYGLKDYQWKINDKGEVEKIDTGVEAGKAPSAGLNQSVAYIPSATPVGYTIKRDAETIASDEAVAENVQYVVYNPALGYLANSEVNQEVGTDIAQIIDDARTQYICGQLDDAGLDKAIQTWRDRGGDRLIEDINRLYKEDTSK